MVAGGKPHQEKKGLRKDFAVILTSHRVTECQVDVDDWIAMYEVGHFYIFHNQFRLAEGEEII